METIHIYENSTYPYPLTNIDPYVTVSNIQYVDPTHTTFSAAVAAAAPTEDDAIDTECYQGLCPLFNDFRIGALINPAAPPPPPPCPAPTVASVTPSTWYAGKTYNIAITGTNFDPTATAACPVTSVYVNAADLSVVPVSNVNVTSTTKITATVTPPASDPTETATVLVSTTYNSATATTEICAAQTITSISVTTLFAGKESNIIIGGTGFITTAAATASCPATTPTVTTPDGSVVTVSKVVVKSSTGITATVSPAANAPTEGATLTVSGAATPNPNLDIFGASQIVCSGAAMQCNGMIISGANATPQTVIVGQTITLTTTPTAATLAALPHPLTPKSHWIVNGTNIGALVFGPPNSSGSPTSLSTTETVTSNPGLTTYWLSPNASVPVSYFYCLATTDCTAMATATFNVLGPESVNLYYCEGTTTSGCSADGPLPPVEINPGPVLEFAGPGIVNGMMFTASDDPSSPAGTFSFVQLLNQYDVVYAYNPAVVAGGPCTANVGSGGVLDNYYPYPPFTPSSAIDWPSAPLLGDDIEVTGTFNANMYLLWTSTATPSIPVPLGYINWGWFGDAIQNLTTQTWSINPNSASPSEGYAGSFVPSSTFPGWTGVSLKSTPQPCVH